MSKTGPALRFIILMTEVKVVVTGAFRMRKASIDVGFGGGGGLVADPSPAA